VVDNPIGDVLKIHKKAIPHLGGLAVFIAFVLSIFSVQVFASRIVFDAKLSALLVSSFAFFLLGVWDDIRWKHISNINPRFKLLLLLLFSAMTAVTLFVFGVPFQFIPLAGFGVAVAFLYILGLVNAVNFEDGLDGLAGGVGVLSLLGFAFVGWVIGDSFIVAVSLLCFGGFLAFLVFNFPPAKIFMGDGGAFFLGCILAVLAIILSRPYDIWSVVGPILIIGVPVFDTGATIVRRILNKTSPFLGDRDHLYDKLYKQTNSIHKTLFLHYGVQLLLVVLGATLYLR